MRWYKVKWMRNYEVSYWQQRHMRGGMDGVAFSIVESETGEELAAGWRETLEQAEAYCRQYCGVPHG